MAGGLRDRASRLAEEAFFSNVNPLDRGVFGSQGKEEPKLGRRALALLVFQEIRKILGQGQDAILSRLAKDFFYDIKELPFNPEKFDFNGLVDRGGTMDVYYLRNKEEPAKSWALKILKSRGGRISFDSLRDAGRSFVKDYQYIKSWYSAEIQKEVFLEQFVLRLKDPRTKKDSIAVLQRYGDELRDVFCEIRRDELVSFLRRDNKLKEVFINFVEETRKHEQQTGEVVDFIGFRNLSIMREGEGYRLALLDPHDIHKTEDENGKGDLSVERSVAMLEYLVGIADELKNDI
ncbi:hypothetical protein GYA54_01030 [Candidatus Kuenenbacteria bacterium]|nr:hypothetical protein [Candidatus Kuenenbacteria bacterium]